MARHRHVRGNGGSCRHPVPGDDASAGAFVVHDQVDGEVFDEEFRVVLQRLLIQRVQHGMAGPVGGGAGALHRAFAEVRHVAAKRTLINLAVVGARERHAEMLKLDRRRARFAAHVFDGVLVAQPVGTLDGVVHVPDPAVLGHVAKRRTDTALGGNSMRTRREDFGDTRGLQAGSRHAQVARRPAPPAPTTMTSYL